MKNTNIRHYEIQNTCLSKLVIESALERKKARSSFQTGLSRATIKLEKNIIKEKFSNTIKDGVLMKYITDIDRIIMNALKEDIPSGDITTDNIIDETSESQAVLIAMMKV